jgi:excisionase family DNA binding protein
MPRHNDVAMSLTEMLTLEQVAEHLQIEPRAVRKLCTRGDLEFVKIGPRTLRFKPEWIEALIKRKQGRG